jgi:hypothetical protein
LRGCALSWRGGVSGILTSRSGQCRSRSVASGFVFMLRAYGDYGHPDAEDRDENNANYDFMT